MVATRNGQSTVLSPTLYFAFELSQTEWKLAFTIGHGQPARLRVMRARDLGQLSREISKAKDRFELPRNARVVSCYEAGRDGFWLHRFCLKNGIENVVVDSSSIEVNRRAKRAKSDGLDASKLVSMLMRYDSGETKVWSVVRVPNELEEDRRRLHRELTELKQERTSHVNRIKGLLASIGVQAGHVNQKFPERLAEMHQWDGSPIPADLLSQVERAWERWQYVHKQICDLDSKRSKKIRSDSPTPEIEQVRKLMGFRGIGENGAWLLVMELFSWRKIVNRKQLGALVGLTPTPYQSGSSAREQGISKAGNRHLRTMMVELAWCWVRFQKMSQLTKWYESRFKGGGKRARKVGIVAVARKLLIALWRYLEHGELPEGATLVTWHEKLGLASK